MNKFYRYDFRKKAENVDNFIRYMLTRTLQMFEYKGLPETIPQKELERFLQVEGYSFIAKHEGELYAFVGGLGGLQGVYGEPTEIVIANPALQFNKTMNLKTEGVLFNSDDMQQGLIPLISKYATILNENEITMILSTINKRSNNLISVSDDNTAESAKKYLEKLEAGELGYIMENRLYDSLKNRATSENSSTKLVDLIELQQYIKASLYNELGLNSNFNMKKERLISEEVEINSNSIYPLVDNMLRCRQEAVEKINAMFETSITVEFSSSWAEGEVQDDSIEAVEEVDSIEAVEEPEAIEAVEELGEIEELEEWEMEELKELLREIKGLTLELLEGTKVKEETKEDLEEVHEEIDKELNETEVVDEPEEDD